MKIAIPIAGDQICTHFGHCEKFMFFDVDQGKKEILKTEIMNAPPHEPGLLPRLLHERGAAVVIAGGMGARARQLFEELGINLVVGVTPCGSPEEIVKSYLSGNLQTGINPCDH